MTPIVGAFKGAVEARLRRLEAQVTEILRQLRNLARRMSAVEQAQAFSPGGGGGGGSSSQVWSTVGKTSPSGISARSGATLGSATCDIYDPAQLPALVPLGSATVYNPFATGADADAYILVVPTADGSYIVAGQDCL